MSDDRHALVLSVLQYVEIAVKTYCSQHPGDFDEYLSAAHLAVCKAAEEFKPERGVQFKTYSERWVRGALIESHRHQFWYKRGRGTLGDRIPIPTTLVASDRDVERLEAKLDAHTLVERHLSERHAAMVLRRFDDVPGHVRAKESGYTLGSLYVTEHELIAKLKGACIRDAARRRHVA